MLVGQATMIGIVATAIKFLQRFPRAARIASSHARASGVERVARPSRRRTAMRPGDPSLSETTRAWVTTSSILVQGEGNLESSVALPRHPMKLSALLLLILLVAGPAAAGTLRVGTVGDYPPFNFIDDAGDLTGFDVDIARALCDEMEVECHFIQEKWAELIISLRAGKFDAIAASMSITERRKRVVSFTDHYYSNVSRFVTSKGSNFHPEANLAGMAIGAYADTIASDWLEENVADVATIELYESPPELHGALTNAKVDAIFGDVLGLYAWLAGPNGGSFTFVGAGRHLDEGIGIAVRREDDELRLRLNQAIAVILADGTYRRINARYFPFSIY